jgi:ribose transport system permease protein
MTAIHTGDGAARLSIKRLGSTLRHLGAPIAFAVVCILFSVASPAFAQPANVLNILDHSAILLVVSMAMTTVIVAGGMDLSVGVALDLGAMVAVGFMDEGGAWPAAIPLGLLTGLLVGLFNAFLIVKVGIGPFLATLGVMFIGQSIQRIYTLGGEPIYMMDMPKGYLFLGRGDLFGVPFETVVAALVLLTFYLFIERTTHGKRLRALGLQYEAARVAGVRVEFYAAMAYALSGLTCALAGVLLSSSLSAYVPISGGFYLLDAIGATFIGTTIDPEARPNVLGTLLGVLFFGVVTNGLNLVGLNFYWKTVAKGVLIFLALALGSLGQRRSA